MMKRCCAVLIMFLAALSCFAQSSFEDALQQEGLTIDEFSDVTTYYYRNPQPEKLLAILRAVLTQSKMIQDVNHFGPFAHLLATVAYTNKAFLENVQELSQGYSGIGQNAIQEIINQAKNFRSPSPDSPQHLDYLWAEFVATGDVVPVEKVIRALGYPDQGMNIMLIGAARWSLASNAAQHKKVEDIIREKALSATGKIKENLEEIIKQLEEVP